MPPAVLWQVKACEDCTGGLERVEISGKREKENDA
jgi:hypothetical protein